MLPPIADRCALFAPDLALLKTTAEIGAYLKAWHGRINDPHHGAFGLGADLRAANTALFDAVIHRLFSLATVAGAPPALAIVATGGYGRRELCPFSDADVTFVAAQEDDTRLNALIKTLFQSLMDVFLYGANLKVGYAYRVIGDLAQLDHQTQTTLLDARRVCGAEHVFKEFRAQFRAGLLTADFLFQKWAERLAVLAKHGGDQVYTVEPNVKEGAGGLRDIHVAEWIGEARFHAGLPRIWPVLAERELLTGEEVAEVAAAREFLLTVRSALHLVSGGAREILTAEKQEAVAALLAYEDSAEVPAVESFMRDYYAHATRARRIARKAVALCLDSEILLGLGLVSRLRAVTVADEDSAQNDPALPLHIAELMQAYGLAAADDLDSHLARFFATHPAPADPALAGRVFSRLLTAGRSVAETLRLLEEWGVLAWLMPEFGALMTLIPYDAAHDYTVGAHSLRVVSNLEQLRTGANPRLIEYHRVIAEVALPETLYLAGLLHDIGKQWSGGDHAETGAQTAAAIAERLGWDTERREKVVFLVRHHLIMAETSRLRDLSLEETVRDFVSLIPDLDMLNMLYVFTYADTAAVGEGVWTEVKGKFLTELYDRAAAVLTASQAPPDGSEPVAPPALNRQRDRIRKGLAQRNLPIDVIHEHTRNMPAPYLLNTPLEEMYLHIAMIGRLRETFLPTVDFKNEYGAEYTEMILCAFDDPKPGLLAKVAGVLYACDVNLHSAQVFTREASVRIAIDTLWMDFRGKPLSSTKRAEVQDNLRRVLLGELGVGELLQNRKKPFKEQTIYAAKIDDAASDRYSILEVSAPDEKGVVYRLARAISALGWNIHAARLAVWGSRARDAFYITGVDGMKVPASDVARLLAALPQTAFSRRKLTPHGGG